MTSMPCRSMPSPRREDAACDAASQNATSHVSTSSSDVSSSGRSRAGGVRRSQPDSESGHLGGDGTARYQGRPEAGTASSGIPQIGEDLPREQPHGST